MAGQLIGEVCQPIELIVPSKTTQTDGAKLGSLKISSAKLYVYTTAWELVTST